MGTWHLHCSVLEHWSSTNIFEKIMFRCSTLDYRAKTCTKRHAYPRRFRVKQRERGELVFYAESAAKAISGYVLHLNWHHPDQKQLSLPTRGTDPPVHVERTRWETATGTAMYYMFNKSFIVRSADNFFSLLTQIFWSTFHTRAAGWGRWGTCTACIWWWSWRFCCPILMIF